MLTSSTVENYLKAIYLAEASLEPSELVPMGQLASSLGVAPGTATTMIKALADAGWVQYAPYSGVRLLGPGKKLAALVLRRHRLVELFLVEVMGMSWAEVHEDAEQLEHAVSDRLVARMDDMLGRPRVDPHGDPIPSVDGDVLPQEFQSLLTCPLGTPVAVTRVADQNAAFLRFIEESHLKPGERIEVEAREAQSDSVRVRRADNERMTIGTRAASKLLVRVLQITLVLLVGSAAAHAQTSPPASAPDSKFEILDNSFLVEEAFNQERGIFQNIFSFVRSDRGDWTGAFTQEWPVPGMKHQLSYTAIFSQVDRDDAFDDLLINYRYQLITERPGRPAFAPRLSLVVPTGNSEKGHGSGTVGLQVNLPFSKQRHDVYFHWNAGFTYLPGVKTGVSGRDVSLLSPQLAGSAIWRMRPMVNLMLEAVALSLESLQPGGGTDRDMLLTLSPGVRFGWNIGDKQVVAGLAVPITRSLDEDNTNSAMLGYFSYELPFRR